MTQDYIRHFGKPQTELKHIFSPYRVCPIGAHVDHQHGLVTGFAIDKGVDLVYTATEDIMLFRGMKTTENPSRNSCPTSM